MTEQTPADAYIESCLIDLSKQLTAAQNHIEELENDLKLLRRQNREQRYEIERLKVPESERYPLGLAPLYVEKKDGGL